VIAYQYFTQCDFALFQLIKAALHWQQWHILWAVGLFISTSISRLGLVLLGVYW
jgi:hypothetical protein